jgi:hypothetical protein
MLKTRYLFQFCTFVCFCSSVAPARADLVSTTQLSGGGGLYPTSNQVRFVLEVTTDNMYGPDPVTPLFDKIISPADVGKTFTVDSSSPFFSHNIGLATDGTNNRVGFSLLQADGSGGGSVFYEAEFFFGAPHSPFYSGRADLSGHSIKRVTFHVDQLSVIPRLPDPSNYYDFKGTISFFDDANVQGTPEPASCSLALLGTFGVVAWRKRRAAPQSCLSYSP